MDALTAILTLHRAAHALQRIRALGEFRVLSIEAHQGAPVCVWIEPPADTSALRRDAVQVQRTRVGATDNVVMSHIDIVIELRWRETYLRFRRYA